MAVTTTAVQAVNTGWTDCGVGPFVNVYSNGHALFTIADTIPTFPCPGFHIQPEIPWLSATTSHLWVTGLEAVVVSR
jgi:hypothetical protein